MIAVGTTSTPERSKFAREIRRWRLKLGLSCAQAASRVGIAGATWTQIEAGYASRGGIRGPYKPSLETVLRIARKMEWPFAEALAAAGIEFDPEDLPADDSPEPEEDSEAFLELLGGMLPMQRKVLLGLMRTMHDPHTDVEKLLKAS